MEGGRDDRVFACAHVRDGSHVLARMKTMWKVLPMGTMEATPQRCPPLSSTFAMTTTTTTTTKCPRRREKYAAGSVWEDIQPH